MKQLFLGLCLLITALFSTQAHAAKTRFGTMQKMKVVAELPKTEEFAIEGTDDYLNLGILYEVFVIKGSSCWVTKEPRIVGLSSKRDDIYYELTPEEIDWIIKEYHLPPAEELKKLSFYDRYLAVTIFIIIIIGTIIALIIYYLRNPEKKKEK